MDLWAENIQSWQTFYATLAGVAATLIGLLFVSITINVDFIHAVGGKHLLRIAAQSFSSLLYILTIALVFLIPEQSPFSLGITLLILGLFGVARLCRRVYQALHDTSQANPTQLALREYWLLTLAYSSLVAVAAGVLRGNFDSLYWLVFTWMSLLVSASNDAWNLIFLIADQRK